MTTKGEWVAYTGSDKQIAELKKQRKGFIYKYVEDGKTLESQIEYFIWQEHLDVMTHYWIIPEDPLREMKIRQAQTGQPVWVKRETIKFEPCEFGGDIMVDGIIVQVTTTPDWNILNAEYSFTAFEE